MWRRSSSPLLSPWCGGSVLVTGLWVYDCAAVNLSFPRCSNEVIAASAFLLTFSISIAPAFAQQQAPLPLPAPPAAPMPRPEDGAVTKKEADNVNAEILEARAATKDKRFADSESLMLK